MKILVFSLDTTVKQPAKTEYDTMRNHMTTNDIAVSNAKGVFNGREENAFICLLNKDIQDKMIMGIAHAYKQESVLEVELPSKKSYIRFIDGTPKKYAGIWKEAESLVKGDFTLDLSNMKVYKCYL